MAQPPHPHHGPSPSPSPYPPYNPLMSADLAALAQQGYAQQQAQLQARAAAQSHTPSQSSQPPPPPGSNPSPHHPAMMNMHHQARAGPSMPPGMAGMAPGMGGHYPALGGQHIPPMGQMQMSPMQMGQMQMGQMVPMGSSPGMPMPMGNVPAHMGQLQHAQMQAFGQAPVTPQQLQQQQQQQQQPPPPPPPQGRMAPGPGQYKPERRGRAAQDPSKGYNPRAAPPPGPREMAALNAVGKPDLTVPEPWTDAIDEVDHRELAMNRFRTRQEILSDIFGPERIRDIPQEERDPWSEFGMDGATLEAKIAEMERENEAMERRLRGGEGVAV
ncbi:hypothetical protein DB88DRAFT_511315 [Papiliotrema laurentii]|uniref:Uncharacterized protein n=1 Tax=Papiliotrema laurentii TaxID=5418 RepID=A0AAD9CZU6_PAPLA|nr:hypothetical protein DB88DRAFT_511315 [Papiliotrema laurentii]